MTGSLGFDDGRPHARTRSAITTDTASLSNWSLAPHLAPTPACAFRTADRTLEARFDVKAWSVGLTRPSLTSYFNSPSGQSANGDCISLIGFADVAK